VYSDLSQRQKALDCYGRALALDRSIGNRTGEAETLGNISSVLKDLARPDTAVRFGKQAVNVLQSIRRDNQNLPDELKRSYAKSIESKYRNLAALLVDQQRFGEAEEVLNLLKDKEASDFIRRDAVADQLRPATLLDSERKALERYEQIVGQVVTLGQQKAALVDKKNQGPLSAPEAEQAARLDGDLAVANRVLLRYLQEQESDFAPSSAVAKRTGDFREQAAGVQKALRQMGPDVVAIYTLVMPDKYIAMLVTSGTRKAYTTTIKEKDLNQKIFTFRQLLQNPASRPQTQAQELYRIVFPEGLRQDLDALHAKTIMWSIDSTLRYVPLAALHDGHDYVVKRFRNSLITPASLTRLTESSTSVWDGTGFGVSEATGNFSALPSVPAELHGIFRQNETETAPIAGAIRLNAEFTRSSFENDLRAKKNSVVHIATHFDSEPGFAANSHLLLGDGSELSLSDIENQQDLFDGVELLTLSACSTAFTNKSEDGREVDSFGTIAQRLGAKGVIASLWSVNDEATARLMETMYRLRQQNPAAGKSEALRLAQEQMASGLLRPDKSKDAAAKDWSHPIYWAPFILIGNWK
jgi:CHAT domain-containing protein